MNLKKDFPIFKNNPDLVYLDSAASSQKPELVINTIKNYLENSYSNIHRGAYDIAEISENLYKKSKQKVCEFIWANNYKEIIYTYNANYAFNLLTQTFRYNNILKAGDKVLLSITEHHANIVPWQILKEEIWIEIVFVNIDENYNLDIEDFKQKYDSKVKVISFTHISNITWTIYDLETIGKLKRDDTLFIIDWSQSIPHISIDLKKLNCDFFVFTGHKIMADTWLWILWGKQEILEKLNSVFSGGWAVWIVDEQSFKASDLSSKFEPGTPNISWAISLLKALEYIESIWWYERIEQIEKELVDYALEKFSSFEEVKLLGSKKFENRIWVFSFYIEWIHSNDIADFMAENNIAVRSGQHCARPFVVTCDLKHSVRMSLYIYNTKEDIDRFFEVLGKMLDLYEK